jgi:protein-S-isoprenylcysteine O-methyltransferase Ste14
VAALNASREAQGQPEQGRDGSRFVIFGMIWGIVWPAMLGGLLYLTSGHWYWPVAWAYLGLYSMVLVAGSFLAIHRDRDFASERTRAKEGTKTWDRWLAGPLFSPLWLAIYAVAGLDKRHSWSLVPAPLAVVGVGLAGLGYGVAVWAMRTNRFYGRYVRIQTDRGHTVVTDGPYRFVRHPAYAGLTLFMAATAIALESLWALIPASAVVAVLVVRTALEDRTLQEELPGYREYAQSTRYRLLPGVW